MSRGRWPPGTPSGEPGRSATRDRTQPVLAAVRPGRPAAELMPMPPEAPAGRVGVPPAAGVLPGQRAFGATPGLAAIGLSFALPFAVAVLAPPIMEPPLPASPGQPPWALAANPSPY